MYTEKDDLKPIKWLLKGYFIDERKPASVWTLDTGWAFSLFACCWIVITAFGRVEAAQDHTVLFKTRELSCGFNVLKQDSEKYGNA